MWSWSDLKVFLAIHRSSSLREAGRELGLNVSTISRRIAALEDGLGTRLFDRRGPTWTLTEAGEELRSLVQRFEVELGQVERRIAGHDRARRAVVRLTYPDVLAELVTTRLPALARAHPGIELVLLPGDQRVDMDRGEADICIRIEDEPSDALFGRKVARLGGAVYAARSYVLHHGEDLSHTDHVWVDWAARYMSKGALRWVNELYPERSVAIRAESGHGVLQAIRAGLGVGVLARCVGEREPDLQRLRDAPSGSHTPIWVLTHPNLRGVAPVRAIMDGLSEALAAQRDLLEGRPQELSGCTPQ